MLFDFLGMNGKTVKYKREYGWFWYFSGKEGLLSEERCGKWMHFFSDQKFAMSICEKAIKEDICYECKCSDLKATGKIPGVICFYLNGDDIANHRRVIEFMLKYDLIKKTKTGKFYNISFKYNYQTRAGEYGDRFIGEIKLANFIDLETGEWIYKR